jgi:hypothetical protein
MYLLLSLSCMGQLQYTTNWIASVIEFKSLLKRKDRCVVCSINRVVITVPLTYISVLVSFQKWRVVTWLLLCLVSMLMMPNYRFKHMTVKYMERCLVPRKQINDSRYKIRIVSQMAPLG